MSSRVKDENAATSSSDEDHFSDASEGQVSQQGSATEGDIPTTRVEKVDDEPSYGEEPGTEAFERRREDAEPDEVEVIPENTSDAEAKGEQKLPVPTLVVEKVDGSSPSYGEVPGTAAYETRKADAEPDVVREISDTTQDNTEATGKVSIANVSLARSANQLECVDFDPSDNPPLADVAAAGHDEDDFGDDFDDFEAGEVDEDFGQFGDESQPQPHEQVSTWDESSSVRHDDHILRLPPVDLDGTDTASDIKAACQAHLDSILSNVMPPAQDAGDLASVNGALLTERSQSLWSQLIAPPPVAPPDWVRSRIRRLFLVSLGVPVDLDEILPASKQKKLVLSSIEANDGRHSHAPEGRNSGAISRLKQENNSTTSVNSTGSRHGRRRGPPPPPEVDLTFTRRLCSTTDIALQNMSDQALQAHVAQLEEYKHKASEMLEYWLVRKDSAIGEKDAFEEVIENLVKHAKKIRK